MIKLFNHNYNRLHGLDHLRVIAILFKRFYIKRMFRIVPAYLTAIVCGFILNLLVEKPIMNLKKRILTK